MDLGAEEWVRKGATLSDKTARAEFGLTQDEIIAAIRAGKLQYRPGEIYGNPWLRLLRREVEDLVSAGHGERYLREQQARALLGEEHREVLAALRRLPGRQREAVVLRYYADFSEAETAAAMGISCGAVKSHTARAIAALRADLGQEAAAGPSPGTT